jgi:hypothetical protein
MVTQSTRWSLQCCGSGMCIPYPDFYQSRIPVLGPGSNNSNKRGEEKIGCTTFFCSRKYDKVIIILIVDRYRNNLSQFTKNIVLLSQNIVTKLPKI